MPNSKLIAETFANFKVWKMEPGETEEVKLKARIVQDEASSGVTGKTSFDIRIESKLTGGLLGNIKLGSPEALRFMLDALHSPLCKEPHGVELETIEMIFGCLSKSTEVEIQTSSDDCKIVIEMRFSEKISYELAKELSTEILAYGDSGFSQRIENDRSVVSAVVYTQKKDSGFVEALASCYAGIIQRHYLSINSKVKIKRVDTFGVMPK